MKDPALKGRVSPLWLAYVLLLAVATVAGAALKQPEPAPCVLPAVVDALCHYYGNAADGETMIVHMQCIDRHGEKFDLIRSKAGAA